MQYIYVYIIILSYISIRFNGGQKSRPFLHAIKFFFNLKCICLRFYSHFGVLMLRRNVEMNFLVENLGEIYLLHLKSVVVVFD